MQAAKEESESWLHDLGDYGEWQTHVMESTVPVVLDCYADWCAPCRRLEPVLKERVKAQEGKLKLVKLNIDSFPKLSSGLNIRSIPAVFLIYRGRLVDTFKGIPAEEELDEFFKTALLLDRLQTDEAIMDDVMAKVEELISAKDLDAALKVLVDSYQLEAWRERYGTHMLIAQAYCKVFGAEDKKDTIAIRASLGSLSEEKVLDLPAFYQKLALDMDTELQRLEQTEERDPEEARWRAELEEAESRGEAPDLQVMQDLATHLIAKNRKEEAIDLLLDSVAIDRNWNERAA